jgi:type I restriction enzyme S subunit
MAVNRWLGYRRTPAEHMPEGWQLKRLRELATFASGGSLGLTMSDYRGEGFDAYSAEGQNGKVAVAEFDGPAVVVSSIGSLCGKSFLAEGKFTTLANVQVVFPKQGEVDPYFLWNLLNAEAFWPRAQTGQPFIRPSDIKKAWIPLPLPLEQSCMAQLFRSVDFLLAKVQAELTAARRLKTALMQQLFTRGIPGRHTSWKPLRVFRQSYDIPLSWEAARLASCIAQIDYGTNEPSNADKTGLPVVAIPQVVSARFELKDCDYTVISADEAAALRLAPNDVLLIRTNGNSEYIGNSTVIGREAEQQHIVFASYLIRIRTKHDRLHGRYLNYFLHSPLGRRQSQAMANTSAGNHNLGARSLRQFWIPRPGEKEQTEIVETLDAVEDLLDSLETELEKAKRLKTSLLQHLLTGKVRIKMEG